ncbi:hypothetical protein [Singulisphaera sp. GP187]|uniref:hypothetical protein n=1 Tax=Singulisphaera sp. GP187 TaxID=1882752 RepID=UPI0020B12715|nr:hypothetical protein [Singulisphaera sp. GP187]
MSRSGVRAAVRPPEAEVATVNSAEVAAAPAQSESAPAEASTVVTDTPVAGGEATPPPAAE